MNVTAEDVDTLARTVFGEARGEPMPGKIAVAWCIRNRVELDLHDDGKPDWWGEGYTAVCRKSWQFSCWNENDPNLPKLRSVTLDDPGFRDCMHAARSEEHTSALQSLMRTSYAVFCLPKQIQKSYISLTIYIHIIK